ncbi:GNAT family N-acetyltransferase [Ferroglobus sp.]|uniref:lipid II:glycine glycyltransferase FemX n=1 Tax=Ferroglobus sp. TaxID=2614230 RepID=UPI0025C5489F|nr:GNAT family N-acetyltransferase [Ferroglobus sp.]
MAEYEVEIVDKRDEWNGLVDRADYTTIFHEWDWLKAVEKHSNTKLYPLVVKKNSTSVAIFPVFVGKKLGLRFALSPPSKAIMVYLGPALISHREMKQSKKETALIESIKAVDNFLKKLEVDYVRIRTPPFLIDSRPFSWSGYSVFPQYTYVLNLEKELSKIWEDLDRSLRRSIEKSRQKGVDVREGGFEDLEFVRLNMKKRFQEMGAKVPEDYYESYFKELFEKYYPEKMRIFVAEYLQELAGGIILLVHKDRVSYWFGMSKTTLKGVYPNDVLQWEAIKWSWESGFRYYEEIDAGDDPRLRHYKAKFNPELVPWFSTSKNLSMLGKVGNTVYFSLKKLKGRF